MSHKELGKLGDNLYKILNESEETQKHIKECLSVFNKHDESKARQHLIEISVKLNQIYYFGGHANSIYREQIGRKLTNYHLTGKLEKNYKRKQSNVRNK